MADTKQQAQAVLEKLVKESKITSTDLTGAAKKVSEIPAAPGITIDTLFDFKGDCIEPVALQIITEALDYAMEVSVSRLTSIGKIFKQVETSAYRGDHGILPVIKAIRVALDKAPLCQPSEALGQVPPLPKPEAKKPPKVISPAAKAQVAVIDKAAAAAKTPAELLASPEMVAAIKGNPALAKIAAEAAAKLTKAIEPAKKPPATKKEASKKTGEPPPYWGTAVFHGEGKEAPLSKEYPSPTALAEALNLETKAPTKDKLGEPSDRRPPPAHDMPHLFSRAGFAVTANGKGKPEKVKAGEPSKFHVRRITRTEDKYKKEVTKGKVKPSETIESRIPDWQITKDKTGVPIYREMIDESKERAGLTIPSTREWFTRRYKVYFDKAGVALGTSEGAEAYHGDYFAVEYMELPAGPNTITGQTFEDLKKIGKVIGGP